MATDTIFGALTFKCGHVTINETIHEAVWGARLIYSEVLGGFSGVVGDRQGGTGDDEAFAKLIFPAVDEAMIVIRYLVQNYKLNQEERGHAVWRKGRVVVVASPQQSYGYLYITAVLEREDHEGETVIWDMSDILNDVGRPVANFSNADLASTIAGLEKELVWYRENKVGRETIRKTEKNLATLKALA